jgi:anti-anti-sigma regulatory factor
MTVTTPLSLDTADSSGPADLRVSLRRVAALYSIGQKLLQAESEDQALHIAVDQLVFEAGYTHALIMTVDYATRMLHSRAECNDVNKPAENFSIPLDIPITTCEVARTGQAHIITDVAETARREGWHVSKDRIYFPAMVIAPFINHSQVQGIISVGLPTEMIVEEELMLIQLFGAQLSTALMQIKLNADRNAALAAAAVAQERLLETVRELSTPAIPIYDGILVLPLVGNIDTGRAAQVMEAVLTGIAREHASVVIVDVTGVPVIDTGVANHLVQVTQAAQLLGARCLLVGIKPEVAQTLVQLGVNLTSIVTRSDLQAGVAFALERRGLQIVASRN